MKRRRRLKPGCWVVLLVISVAVALVLWQRDELPFDDHDSLHDAMDDGFSAMGADGLSAMGSAHEAKPVLRVPWRAQPLTAIDHLILRVCGEPGDRVSNEQAERVLELWEHVSVEPVDWELATRTWTGHALRHVFCGDFRHGALGGLHWAPRWEQLIGMDIAIDPSCRTHADPPIDKLGLLFIDRAGELHRECPKSVVGGLAAETLLEAGMIGMHQGDHCAVETAVDGQAFWLMIRVRDGRLRSVYPVGSPEEEVCDLSFEP